MLSLLAAAYALNFLDRQIVNILGGSIKADLHLSDAEFGLLTGTAFGLFYATLGIPIARLADRTQRVGVLSLSLLVWSSFTMLCGFVKSYPQLFLARMGVGIGEAGGTPPSQSLICDYFPDARRATMLAIFNLGLPIGSALGFFVGGALEAAIGWQWTMIVAGIPGIVLAIVIKLCVRELPRGTADGLRSGEIRGESFGRSLKTLLANRSYLLVITGAACAVFMIYVTNAWIPQFFARVHGMKTPEIGAWIALCISVGGGIGVLGGGLVADGLKRRQWAGDLWVPAITLVVAFAAFLLILFAKQVPVALGAMFVMYLFGFAWIGPTSATAQRLAPVTSRSLATGVQLLIGNIVSLTLGPPLVGYFSDRFLPVYGDESLRYALLCVSWVGLLGAVCYIAARPRDAGAARA